MSKGHRFSNRSQVREEILFRARHEAMHQEILNLRLPRTLQFALELALRAAVKEVLA